MKKLFTLIAMFSIASLSLNAQEWTEDFESGSLPTNWTVESNATDGGFLVGSDMSSAYWPIAAHTIYAGTNDDECNCDKANEELTTHEFNIPADDTYVLSLAYNYPDGTGSEDAKVNISNDGGDTWSTLTDLDPVGDWTNVNYLLEGYSGDSIILSFFYDDNGVWGYGLMLDDISVSAVPDVSLAAVQVLVPEIYTTEDGSLAIATSFYNNGLNEVTEFEMHYQVDAEPEVVNVVSGLSIATFESAVVVSPTVYDAAALGNKSINVWATEINAVASTTSNEVTGAVQITDQHSAKVGLSETFTSNTCGPCAGFNPPYQVELDAINTNEAGSDYVAIKYQVNWPSPGNDVCYNDDVLNRRDYYGVNSVPTTMVESVPNDYEYNGPAETWDDAAGSVSSQFQDLTDQNGWVGITTTVLWDNVSDVDVDISITPDANFDANTQTLYVAVMNMYYDNTEISPSGTNGETEWTYVMRKMLPDGNGTGLGALTTGETVSYNFTYTFSIGDVSQGSFDLVNENIKVIAWVQDDSNMAIRNASLGDMSLGLEEVSTISDFQIYPNPTSDVAHISLNLVESNKVTIEVTDLLGKVVYAEEKGRLQAGNHTFDVDAASIGNGMYLFNVYVDKQKVTKRISITK